LNLRVNNPKDFWLGAVYLVAGAGALGLGTEYPLGTAGRMGPGYFPAVIASLLILFGIAAVARSFMTTGDAVGITALKPLVLITGAVVAFGFLLNGLGFAASLAVLIVMSAAASEAFRFDWKASLGVVALVVFCSLLFVRALGVPLPLVGAWIAPVVPVWLGG
jgi:hypothetical protein